MRVRIELARYDGKADDEERKQSFELHYGHYPLNASSENGVCRNGEVVRRSRRGRRRNSAREDHAFPSDAAFRRSRSVDFSSGAPALIAGL
jgi:hypothetical protein